MSDRTWAAGGRGPDGCGPLPDGRRPAARALLGAAVDGEATVPEGSAGDGAVPPVALAAGRAAGRGARSGVGAVRARLRLAAGGAVCGVGTVGLWPRPARVPSVALSTAHVTASTIQTATCHRRSGGLEGPRLRRRGPARASTDRRRGTAGAEGPPADLDPLASPLGLDDSLKALGDIR